MTEWRSWEAVTAFAGPRQEVAVVEPETRAMLSGVDEHVEHFTVAVDAGGRSRRQR